MSEGHIELARSVTSIRVGHRFRTDWGDLDELCESIALLGLLQPITISPDGTLICGARRYAAVLKLGWKTVNVWVRSGISTDLQRLLAEQHENTVRQNFTPTEVARRYVELKRLYQEDAERRKQVTQFTAARHGGQLYGPGNFPGPRGESRVQAAEALGAGSYRTLEHIAGVQAIVDDPAAAPVLREVAARELAAMDADGKVHPHFLQVEAARAAVELGRDVKDSAAAGTAPRDSSSAVRRVPAVAFADDPQGDLAGAAQAALLRARQAQRAGRLSSPPGVRRPPEEPKRLGVRAFVMMIADTDFWWVHFDPAQIRARLSPAQWDQFEDWVAQAVLFLDAARAAAEHCA